MHSSQTRGHHETAIPDILTPAQAAERLQVGTHTVLRMCRRGEMPGACKVGRQWRIAAWGLEQLFAPGETQGEGEPHDQETEWDFANRRGDEAGGRAVRSQLAARARAKARTNADQPDVARLLLAPLPPPAVAHRGAST